MIRRSNLTSLMIATTMLGYAPGASDGDVQVFIDDDLPLPPPAPPTKKQLRRERAIAEGGRAGDAYHEVKRATPLGGKAHAHQVVCPPSLRPNFVKTPRFADESGRSDRAIAAGGSLWWRTRMEVLRARRAPGLKKLAARTAEKRSFARAQRTMLIAATLANGQAASS